MTRKRQYFTVFPLLPLLVTFCFICSAYAARIKDIATIKGVRDNKLVGYGLVVGLNGTGDKSGVEFTVQSLSSMLKKQGISIKADDIKVKNIAAVMISAVLPPFVQPGTEIDVTVSSIGDATSLQGGTILFTPLYGPDGHVYAIAQGAISLGGFVGGSGGDTVQKNHPTVGRISRGAIVEKSVPGNFLDKDRIVLNLDSADFLTARGVADKINKYYNNLIAFPLNSSSVEVMVPDKYKNRLVGFVSDIEVLDVPVDQRAKVVLNERTGTVIMGQHVTISTVAISHGNLTIEINTELNVSQPEPLSDGKTVVVADSGVAVREDNAKLIIIHEAVNIGSVVSGLNAIGVTPRDLIAILQAMKAAGALQADLRII